MLSPNSQIPLHYLCVYARAFVTVKTIFVYILSRLTGYQRQLWIRPFKQCAKWWVTNLPSIAFHSNQIQFNSNAAIKWSERAFVIRRYDFIHKCRVECRSHVTAASPKSISMFGMSCLWYVTMCLIQLNIWFFPRSHWILGNFLQIIRV